MVRKRGAASAKDPGRPPGGDPGGAPAGAAQSAAAAASVLNPTPASKAAAAAKGADVAGFNEIKARLKQAPDFDRAKVESIKQSIANGQYPLNPRRIAESFVSLEQMIGQ